MTIVHVTKTDLDGGAGIAAFRLHRALRAHGINSKMYVLVKLSDDDHVICAKRGPRLLAKLREFGISQEKKFLNPIMDQTQAFWSTNAWPTWHAADLNRLNPDIIHLHWISRGCLSVSDIKHLKAKRIIWSLHDLWPFTGGFHYHGCYNTKGGLSTYPEIAELAAQQENKKRKHWKKPKWTWVPLSTWIERELLASKLHLNLPSKLIWNSVPTDTYFPYDAEKKLLARKTWGIQTSGIVFLFGALYTVDDPRKGRDLLVAAIAQLPQYTGPADLVPWFVSFGGNAEHIRTPNGYIIHNFERISDDEGLVRMYNCANLFICPSREDNLPNTCLESIACGVPVVSFKIGGLVDIVLPEVSGFLIEPFDVDALASHIESAIGGELPLDKLGISARKLALERFSPAKQVAQHLSLYTTDQ